MVRLLNDELARRPPADVPLHELCCRPIADALEAMFTDELLEFELAMFMKPLTLFAFGGAKGEMLSAVSVESCDEVLAMNAYASETSRSVWYPITN